MGCTNNLNKLNTDSVIKKKKWVLVGSTIPDKNFPGKKENLQE